MGYIIGAMDMWFPCMGGKPAGMNWAPGKGGFCAPNCCGLIPGGNCAAICCEFIIEIVEDIYSESRLYLLSSSIIKSTFKKIKVGYILMN